MKNLDSVLLSFPEMDKKSQLSTKGGYDLGYDDGFPIGGTTSPPNNNDPDYITNPANPQYLYYWTGSYDPDFIEDPSMLNVLADSYSEAEEEDQALYSPFYGMPTGGTSTQTDNYSGSFVGSSGWSIEDELNIADAVAGGYMPPDATVNKVFGNDPFGDPYNSFNDVNQTEEINGNVNGTEQSALISQFYTSDSLQDTSDDAYWIYMDTYDGDSDDMLASLTVPATGNNDPDSAASTPLLQYDPAGGSSTVSDAPYVSYLDAINGTPANNPDDPDFQQPVDLTDPGDWYVYEDEDTDVDPPTQPVPTVITKIGSDGKVQYSSDGVHWDSTAITVVDEGNGLYHLEKTVDGKKMVSYNDAASWSIELNQVSISVHNTQLRENSYGFIEYSFDGGKTWVGHGMSAYGSNQNGRTRSSSVSSHLAQLSKAMESGRGGPGTVSTGKGDKGGVSYGSWQFASNSGTPQAVLKSSFGSQYASYFTGMVAGSPEFSAAWKQAATDDPAGFEQAQFDFTMAKFYTPSSNLIYSQTGIDVNSMSEAVQQLVFATAIQFGPQTAVFRNALDAPNASNMTDAEFIERVITEELKPYSKDPSQLAYFHSSSIAVQNSVRTRLKNELHQLLAKVATPGI